MLHDVQVSPSKIVHEASFNDAALSLLAMSDATIPLLVIHQRQERPSHQRTTSLEVLWEPYGLGIAASGPPVTLYASLQVRWAMILSHLLLGNWRNEERPCRSKPLLAATTARSSENFRLGPHPASMPNESGAPLTCTDQIGRPTGNQVTRQKVLEVRPPPRAGHRGYASKFASDHVESTAYSLILVS